MVVDVFIHAATASRCRYCEALERESTHSGLPPHTARYGAETNGYPVRTGRLASHSRILTRGSSASGTMHTGP